MKEPKLSYALAGCCATEIKFRIYNENDMLYVLDVEIIGGCSGNSIALGKLMSG